MATTKRLALLLLLCTILMGCKSEPIRQYTVASELDLQKRTLRNGLSWKLPKGWLALQPTGMRIAAFSVGIPPETGLVTVTRLPKSGFDLLANVNRWEGQLNQPKSTADTLSKVATETLAGAKRVTRVHLDNKDQSMTTIIETYGEDIYFIKLTGSPHLVHETEAKLMQFVADLLVGDAQ